MRTSEGTLGGYHRGVDATLYSLLKSIKASFSYNGYCACVLVRGHLGTTTMMFQLRRVTFGAVYTTF